VCEYLATIANSADGEDEFPFFNNSALSIHNNLAETVVMSNDAWDHGQGKSRSGAGTDLTNHNGLCSNF
jgi:hypothetical protein